MIHQSSDDDIISEHQSTLRMFGQRPMCPATEKRSIFINKTHESRIL